MGNSEPTQDGWEQSTYGRERDLYIHTPSPLGPECHGICRQLYRLPTELHEALD